MQGFTVLNKVPYFDAEDTIAEVGITRRQLGHWQDQGLLQPELGEGKNKYTALDIRRLKALRYLIVEQKMPIPLVKELVEGGEEYVSRLTSTLIETSVLFAESGPHKSPFEIYGTVFDFETKTTMSKDDFAISWRRQRLAMASESEIEREVQNLTLLLFRAVRQRLQKPAAFTERRDEILQRLAQLSDFARVVLNMFWSSEPEDLDIDCSPVLQDDALDPDHMPMSVFLGFAERLNEYRDALPETAPQWYRERFWNEDVLNALHAKLYPSFREHYGYPPLGTNGVSSDAETTPSTSESNNASTTDIVF
jgi:DNA-binding transcriptional MerR regulator